MIRYTYTILTDKKQPIHPNWTCICCTTIVNLLWHL